MYKKKSLGQHFLNPNYAKKVADAANITPGELVLEVGPGEGVLTRELLARGASVVAIEKDDRLLPVLEHAFSAEIASRRLEVVVTDALEFDPGQKGFFGRPYKIVANIPYYITGALLRQFLSATTLPKSMVLLLQKEVAERIARSKKESILSLSIKAYGEPVYVQTVPRGAFSPAPEVDSAILLVRNISRQYFATMERERRYFDLLHAGFGQKRKLLKSNLEPIFGEKTAEYLTSTGIPLNARAEDVPMEQWVELAKLS